VTTVSPTLAAVLANPDDLLARLLHAEALEALGDPRGEFIRVQCALVAETSRSVRIGLRRREADLLREYGRVWRAPAEKIGVGATLCRGFIEKVEVSLWRGLPKGLEALFALEPVRDVSLGFSQKADAVSAFFALGLLPRLTHLRMSGSESLVAKLADTEGAESLRYLGLNNYGGKVAGLARVAGSPRLAGLEELCVGRVDDAGLAALCAKGRRWRSLYLSGSTMTGAGIVALADSSAMEGLRILCLNRCSEVGDDALIALAKAPAAAALSMLELDDTAITAKGARALAGSAYLQGLTRLRVRGTGAAKGAALKALRARWPRAVIA